MPTARITNALLTTANAAGYGNRVTNSSGHFHTMRGSWRATLELNSLVFCVNMRLGSGFSTFIKLELLWKFYHACLCCRRQRLRTYVFRPLRYIFGCHSIYYSGQCIIWLFIFNYVIQLSHTSARIKCFKLNFEKVKALKSTGVFDRLQDEHWSNNLILQIHLHFASNCVFPMLDHL